MPLDLVEAPARSGVPRTGRTPRHAATAPPEIPLPAPSRTTATRSRPGRRRSARSVPVPSFPARSVDVDPPTRPRARHRRPLDLPELADRWWGRLLALAVAVFAACGPAHALGHTDLVYHAVLVGLTLSALAVPLGLWALRRQPTAPEVDHATGTLETFRHPRNSSSVPLERSTGTPERSDHPAQGAG